MRNLRSIVIYGVIILLCVAAVTEYIITNRAGKTSTVSKNATNETVEASKAAETKAANENTTEKIEHNAVMITDGNNITGKSEEEKQKHIEEVMAKAFTEADPNPVIGIGRGEDYAAVTAAAIENAGGLKDIIKKGDVILIKPNICTKLLNAGGPQITDYRVVQKIADLANQYGASKVIVAEGSFSGNVFDYEGNKYVSLKGVELFNFNSCEEKDCYKLMPQKSLVGIAIYIPKIYMDADVVIDVAKLKTHGLTGVSLSLKNCIGIPSAKIYGTASKTALHNMGLEQVIIDLNRIRKPDFAVIDGIVGGEGTGPVANTPVKSNIVLAGKDLVALDTVGLTFMGGKIDSVTHLILASKNGLGISDLNKIKIVGADLNSIKMKFQPISSY